MVESPTPTSLDGYTPFSDERIEEYRSRGYWKDLTFHEVLDRGAESSPDKPFVVDSRGETTYSEARARSERIAAYLLGELDLNPMDRIVIQLTNRAEFLELFFGCSRAGVIPVVLLPRHRRAEATHVVDLTEAKALVTIGPRSGGEFDHVGMADEIAADSSTLDHLVAVNGDSAEDGQGDTLPEGWIDYSDIVGTDWTETDGEGIWKTPVDPTHPGLMLLSGGTTGMPKVIPRTHNDYVFQWSRWVDALGIEPSWTVMPWVPIGHNASLNPIVGAATIQGATVVIESTLKAKTLLERTIKESVDYFFAVPTQLVDVLEQPDVDELDLSGVSVVITGGQKVRPRIVRELNDRWNIDVANNFGMAEGPLFSTRPDDDLTVQAETIGRPIAPDADDYRIVDGQRDEDVPPGTPGELAGRGPGVFTGYFRNQEENDAAFDTDGWFYTEDVLELGGDGNYRVHGRLKDTIIRGGENIYAPGLEDELIEHPKVANVAVVGMPDERLGERPMAYVELEAGTSTLALDELTEFLDDRGVAVFKRPERIEVIESLPRTEVGKISKVDLRERITAKLKAEGTLPEEF